MCSFSDVHVAVMEGGGQSQFVGNVCGSGGQSIQCEMTRFDWTMFTSIPPIPLQSLTHMDMYLLNIKLFGLVRMMVLGL